jgi:hypothetical protein
MVSCVAITELIRTFTHFPSNLPHGYCGVVPQYVHRKNTITAELTGSKMKIPLLHMILITSIYL